MNTPTKDHFSSFTKTKYFTTAIDFPNAKPHIGHAFEKILADCYTRWYRLINTEASSKTPVYFLTGTDENGQKLQHNAKKHHYSNVLSFVNHNAQIFRDFCHDYQISFSDFIRTSEPRHHKFTEKVWIQLTKKDLIYQGVYQGYYCYECEQFYPDSQLSDDKTCPVHHIKLSYLEEQGYFFRLSSFQDQITNYIETNPEFIFPISARDEMLSRLKKNQLKDLAISRKNKNWGITVPEDKHHVIYTWFDALLNYYTPIDNKDFPSDCWPCDIHFIGKDITWFHCVIWPAILLGLDLEFPKHIYVHGMVLDAQGRKMSKTLGNIICPIDLIKNYSLDTIKYTMIKSMPNSSDGVFSIEHMIDLHNNKLANELGNLISRVIKLALKNNLGLVKPYQLDDSPSWIDDWNKLFESPIKLFNTIDSYINQFNHPKAIDRIFFDISQLNTFLNLQAPWKITDNHRLFSEIIYQICSRIHLIAWLLQAFLPDGAKIILHQSICPKYCEDIYNNSDDKNYNLMMELIKQTNKSIDHFNHQYTLKNTVILYPKIEKPKQNNKS